MLAQSLFTLAQTSNVPFISHPIRSYTSKRHQSPTLHGVERRTLRIAGLNPPRNVSLNAKRPTIAELSAEVEQYLAIIDALKQENQELRAALAQYQGTTIESAVESEAAGSTPSNSSKTAAAPKLAASTSELAAGIKWPSPSETNFWERPARDKPAAVPPSVSSRTTTKSSQRDARALHIVHVTAEMAPIAKVGGLGDVVTGLSRACIDRGHNVEIMLPFYQCLPEDQIEDLQFSMSFDCPKGRSQDGKMEISSLKTEVYTGKIEGCPVLLVKPDWGSTGSPLFQGGRIYGGSYNEAEAYLYFSRACLEYLKISGRQPDVIHAHEWQASAVPMLYWEAYAKAFPRARPVLTIHNMDNSGECRSDEFCATGVDGEAFVSVDKALDERTIGHNPERLCLLKGGMVYSSAITTVSPNYANETLNGGAAGWLKSTLARPDIAGKYSGVLNGIDTAAWDPSTDPFLPACYSSVAPDGKALCKEYLQKGFGMTLDPKKPIVAVISRLVPQKGIHLIEHAAARTIQLGGQFVLLGTGHADGGLKRMANETFKDNPDMKLIFAYSERLAHLIYAAADMFLVPSMFEPCGLTQMIALRYGAIPIVRSTGGLADTVRDVDQSGPSSSGVEPNGFVFDGIDSASLESAFDRAFVMYRDRPEEWEKLCLSVMSEGDMWSWELPASRYVETYYTAIDS